MKSILLTISLITFMFSGCGYKEGVVTTTAKSYIYFSGDVNSAVVTIDEGDSFNVKAGQNNLYTVKPGKHIIKVYKNGELKIKKEIYISDGISKEIEIK